MRSGFKGLISVFIITAAVMLQPVSAYAVEMNDMAGAFQAMLGITDPNQAAQPGTDGAGAYVPQAAVPAVPQTVQPGMDAGVADVPQAVIPGVDMGAAGTIPQAAIPGADMGAGFMPQAVIPADNNALTAGAAASSEGRKKSKKDEDKDVDDGDDAEEENGEDAERASRKAVSSDWIKDWEYHHTEGSGKVTLTKFKGRGTEISIPGLVFIDEEECEVHIEKGDENVFPALLDSVIFGSDGNKVVAEGSFKEFFYYCPNLKCVDFTGLDTSSVTDMEGLFYCCRSLKYVDMSSLSTSGLKNASDMFKNCTSLTVIDLSGTDFSAVEDMTGMFEGCDSLTVLKMPALISFYMPSGFAEFPFAMYSNYIEFPQGEAVTAMLQGLTFTSTPVFFFVDSIEIEQHALMVDKGAVLELEANVYPEDASLPELTWSSDDTTIVRVDSDGKIHALAKGSANVTARSVDGSGIIANCMVIVNPVVSSVRLDQTEVSMGLEQTVTLTAEVLPEDVEDRRVVWSVTGSSVRVSDEGVLTALKPGVSTVTATSADGSKSAKCKVSVSYNPYAVSIRMNETEYSLVRGESFHLDADVIPHEADQSVSWSSSDENVVSVTRSGIITGLLEGSAVVTAVSGDGKCSESCAVTVVAKEPCLSENHALEMSVYCRDEEVSDELTLSAGSIAPLLVRLKGEEDIAVTDRVYYSSSNEDVIYLKNISVDGMTGFFETVGTGSARVDIRCGALIRSVTVNVIRASGGLSFADIEGGIIYIEPGEARRLYAVPADPDSTEDIHWEIDRAGRKLMTLNNGLIKARNREGTAVISAYTDSMGKEGAISLEVRVHDSKPVYENTSKNCRLIASRNISLEIGGKKGRTTREIRVRPSGRGFLGARVTKDITNENVCSVRCTDPGENRYVVTAHDTGVSYIVWTAEKKVNGVETYAYYVTKVIVTKPVSSIEILGADADKSVELKEGSGLKLNALATPGYTDDNDISWVVKGRGISISESGYVTAEKKTDKPVYVYARVGSLVSRPVRITVRKGEDHLSFGRSVVVVNSGDREVKKMISLNRTQGSSGDDEISWYLEGAEDTGITIEKARGLKARLIVPAGAEPGNYRILAASPGLSTAECELVVN